MKLVILQIKDIENCDYAFRGYDENKFKLSDYEVVFCCDGIDIKDYTDDYDLLERIYAAFNRVTPSDEERLKSFKGRSLSMSDLVDIDGRTYYCDTFGWEKINLH